MKTLLYFLGPVLFAAALAYGINYWLSSFDNPGYVIIGLGHWSMETSLIVLLIGIIISFLVFYLLFRMIGWVFRLPGRMKKRGAAIRFNRSQEALIAGLVDSAEGNWEKAEKVLIKHASHSGAPLIHYLTAAKAAQSRGAFDKRDEYLKKAADQAPGSDVAIGLTQAELHLSGNQFEEALETLTRLHSINPTHASVLKLLHQTYHRVGDWEGIRKLIPSLNSNKILMEAEVKLLETEAYSQLLKRASSNHNVEEIQALWSEIPAHIKRMHGISAIYFASMIDAGAGYLIEQELADILSVNFDDTLLILFGSIESTDQEKQLETAEQWLLSHSENAVLLYVLGKLSSKCQDFQKAEGYLSKSIRLEPTVQAYRLLGDLLYSLGNKDQSSQCYKSGLELASSEVVSHIDTVF